MKSTKGQASIEFMLILTAALIFTAIFAAGFSEVKEAAFIAIDAQEGKRAAEEIEAAGKYISLLGDGSAKKMELHATNKWEFKAGTNPNITIKSEKGKTAEIKLPQKVKYQVAGKTLKGKIELILEKKSGELILKQN